MKNTQLLDTEYLEFFEMKNGDHFTIRFMHQDEYGLLNDFLYESIFVHDGDIAPDRSILQLKELSVYVEEFGKKKDDLCFVAEVNHRVVGAVWVRDMLDYGHIEDGVPSFAIALYKAYRGRGIGTHLMRTMLNELQTRGYSKASLSCQKENPALKLYKKLGFETVIDKGEEVIMVKVL